MLANGNFGISQVVGVAFLPSTLHHAFDACCAVVNTEPLVAVRQSHQICQKYGSLRFLKPDRYDVATGVTREVQ